MPVVIRIRRLMIRFLESRGRGGEGGREAGEGGGVVEGRKVFARRTLRLMF